MNEHKFTPSAEEILRLSQEAAGELGHGYVGTEHLLLGLLREPVSIAHQVLTEAGLTDDMVVEIIKKSVGAGLPGSNPAQGLTPRARRVVEIAVEDAARRKKLDCSAAELLTVEEGLCVQMLHRGPFETEPETVRVMDAFLAENGYVNDLTDCRLHHEIYLSDARKTASDRWRTILRHPVRKVSS